MRSRLRLMISTRPRRLAATLATLGAAALLSAPSRGPVAGNEILWDRYGVPHIYAANAERLAYGFGYAQMQNHADLLLMLYGEARGRAAEYWGKEYLESDRLMRRLEVPARAEEWYRQQSPSFKRYLDGFVAGINAYAREHPSAIADSLKVALPITAADVLAHGQRVINIMFVMSPPAVAAQVRRWQRSNGAGQATRPGDEASAEEAAMRGSNAWAVAPSHSANGHAMLLANPHLPWSDLFTWMEAQLTSPEIDVYGATLVGSPVIAIGFNDYLGWTHTVNTHDGVDLYELTLSGDGYRFDSADHEFEVTVDTIKVKEAAGTRVEVMRTKHSAHGPVLAEAGGKALAVRVVGLDRPGAAEEWWDMGRAKNLAEFERVLRRLQIPMFTVMYADRDGRIMHFYNALVPERVGGDWASWLGIIPGDSSGSLWTHMLSYEALPKLRDPSTGWLQNANDPPWYTTVPLSQSIDPSEYPVYIAPRGMAMRPQHSAKLVSGDAKLSFEELVRRKHDTRVELADRLLDDLGAAVRAATPASDRATRAMAVLDRWDRMADAESRGAVLFEAWWWALLRRSTGSPYATPWSAARPLETPDGLTDPAIAVAALDDAAAQIERRYGALDVAWGTAHRFRRDGVDFPANGGTGSLGIFRVIEYPENDTTARSDAAMRGDSFIAAVEFSNPVRAQTLIGYGNASQPGSPHRSDQMSFLAKKELRPVWRTRAEIEKNLESRKAY